MGAALVTTLALASAGVGLGGGCATQVPATRSESVLYRDLERIVSVSEAAGWEIDRLEIEGALGDALLSVCQATPATRAALLEWIDARIAVVTRVAGGGASATSATSADGPVAELWRRRGRKLREIAGLLTLVRARGLLVAAIDATAEDCPFWLEASDTFAGRQIVDDRWQLELAGGGKGILGLATISEVDALDVTGGGAGRVSVYRHFGPRWSLGLGFELGGSADFLRDELGNRAGLVFALDLVAPLALRYRLVSSFYELEIGALGHGREGDGSLVPGLHVGIAVGGLALRQRWFVPGAALALSYEQTFPDDGGSEPLKLIKIGVRVSLDIDL